MNNLKHIEINIWKACNNKCRFCMSSDQQLWDIKFYDFDKLKEKIVWHINNGFRSIWFLWWDVSIYPHIVELISFCRSVWFEQIHAITNGMLFSNYEFAKKVVYAGLTRVNISIHSHISQVEDYLTQVPNGLQKKFEAIKNFQILHASGLLNSPVSINMVLNQKNYTTIVESVLFFSKKLWINDIRINFIWLDESIEKNWDDLKVSYTEFFPYLKKLIYVSLKENIRLTFDAIPPCIFYEIDKKNYKMIISRFLGEEYDHINEIDWTNWDKQFSWQEQKKDTLKTQFRQCTLCEYSKTCQWVWKEYAKIYWDKEFINITNI